MVAYPVHFKHNKESLENKILLCLTNRTQSVCRGGCLVGDNFVYGLLDWQLNRINVAIVEHD